MPRGDLGAAEARLRAAVERDPYLGDAWGALADVLASRGATGEARQVLAAALERLPGDPRLREKLDRLPAAAGAPAPAPAAEEALRARLRHAVEDYQRGDRAAAVAVLEALAAEHPDYAPAWVNLSWIALDEKRWDAAADGARRALALDPTLARAWENLGTAREAQGRLGEAEEAYRRAVEGGADAWPARLKLALLLLRGGREAEAEGELAGLEKTAADEPEARFQLGRVYEAKGDRERARRHYEAVIRLAPGGPLAAAAAERLRGL